MAAKKAAKPAPKAIGFGTSKPSKPAAKASKPAAKPAAKAPAKPTPAAKPAPKPVPAKAPAVAKVAAKAADAEPAAKAPAEKLSGNTMALIEVVKDGHFFIARTETHAGTKEYKNTVFEDLLTEMLITLQEQLQD